MYRNVRPAKHLNVSSVPTQCFLHSYFVVKNTLYPCFFKSNYFRLSVIVRVKESLTCLQYGPKSQRSCPTLDYRNFHLKVFPIFMRKWKLDNMENIIFFIRWKVCCKAVKNESPQQFVIFSNIKREHRLWSQHMLNNWHCVFFLLKAGVSNWNNWKIRFLIWFSWMITFCTYRWSKFYFLLIFQRATNISNEQTCYLVSLFNNLVSLPSSPPLFELFWFIVN